MRIIQNPYDSRAIEVSHKQTQLAKDKFRRSHRSHDSYHIYIHTYFNFRKYTHVFHLFFVVSPPGGIPPLTPPRRTHLPLYSSVCIHKDTSVGGGCIHSFPSLMSFPLFFFPDLLFPGHPSSCPTRTSHAPPSHLISRPAPTYPFQCFVFWTPYVRMHPWAGLFRSGCTRRWSISKRRFWTIEWPTKTPPSC